MTFVTALSLWWNCPQHPINRARHSQPRFDSAPGHQKTPKPPSGGFFIANLLLEVEVLL
jgi:hypothetical protein